MTTDPSDTSNKTNKPKRRLPLILGALLGLCLLLAIIGALSGGGDQPAAPVATDTPPPAVAAQPAPTATLAPPADTPIPPTATPQPPTPTPAIAQVGQRVEAGGIALTINSADTMASFDFMTAVEGKTYLVLDALIENVGRDTAPYNPLYFSLKDADGFQYNSSLLAPDPSLKSGDLPQGDRVRGNIAFEIPVGAAGLVLTYEPLVILGGYQPLRVSIQP
jgi:hypothetical protein